MSIGTRHEFDKDYYAWTLHNAELVREKRFDEIDIDHIAEELENMGKSSKRELVSRLAVLIAHLLKWQLQPERRGKSWRYTIKEQRLELLRLLKESPSLKHYIETLMIDAYEQAVVTAVKETSLDEQDFPKTCPFSLSECLDHEFFPSEA